MATVTIQEAQAKLADLIHNLSPGDEVVITENNQPVAKLVSQLPKSKAGLRPPPGLGKGFISDPCGLLLFRFMRLISL
ncbi:MAG: type II toxin-antitoxin system prevent-host-death family antitoxin [Firmicutes bacterium]|nr:type II toxin-antitoxin system prevent-host-death family antitoxin [Bacillota bacterium]